MGAMRKLLSAVLVSFFALMAALLTLAWINTRRRTAAPPAPPARGGPAEPATPPAEPGEVQAGGPETTEPERCAATTGSGRRCSRPAEEGSRHCWQHQG